MMPKLGEILKKKAKKKFRRNNRLNPLCLDAAVTSRWCFFILVPLFHVIIIVPSSWLPLLWVCIFRLQLGIRQGPAEVCVLEF